MHLFLFSFLPLFKEILNVVYDKPRQYIEKQSHHFADKGLYSQNYGFSSSHVWIWELAHKEAWAPKNWCFWIVVVEKTLDSKDIKAVNPKENQLWIFTGRIDAEAEAPILWPPDARNWLTGKDPNVGRLRAGGEGGDRKWDGWVASLTQWTWVWANRTGKGSLECTAIHGVTESDTTSVQFSSVQSISRVQLFVIPWFTARQTSLSITNFQSSLRLTSIESVMPSSHLILCYPLLLLPPIPPSIRVFSNESTLHMRWPK